MHDNNHTAEPLEDRTRYQNIYLDPMPEYAALIMLRLASMRRDAFLDSPAALGELWPGCERAVNRGRWSADHEKKERFWQYLS